VEEVRWKRVLKRFQMSSGRLLFPSEFLRRTRSCDPQAIARLAPEPSGDKTHQAADDFTALFA
jgi:hypothetical protein